MEGGLAEVLDKVTGNFRVWLPVCHSDDPLDWISPGAWAQDGQDQEAQEKDFWAGLHPPPNTLFPRFQPWVLAVKSQEAFFMGVRGGGTTLPSPALCKETWPCSSLSLASSPL